jgi:hypothetical protein
MKKIISLCLWAALVATPLSAAADVTLNDRLLQRPERDGAVVQNHWLEGSLRIQDWDDFDAWLLGPTFMTTLPTLPALELGTRFGIIHFDPDGAGSETGLTDIDLWGKYQFYRDAQMMLSGGLLLTLPTGRDDVIHPRASGEINVEAFVAGRYQADRQTALIAHFMLRRNSDMDIEINNFRRSIDGKFQMGIGAGIIYEVAPALNLIGEFNLATEAYDDMDNEIQLWGGAEYKLAPGVSLRGGLGIGLDDGSPDIEIMLAGVFTF